LPGRSEQVPQRIGGVVAAGAVFVHVAAENVLGAARVVLERGQAGDEPPAALMDEKLGWNSRARVAEGGEHRGPARNARGKGRGSRGRGHQGKGVKHSFAWPGARKLNQTMG